MAISSLVWKLASPYDAYVSHVASLTYATERIQYLSGLAMGYQAGIDSSHRIGESSTSTAGRAERFRAQLGEKAANMSDEEFEDFLAMLGGGQVADVDSAREQAVSRLGHMQRGLEEYFALAGHELAILEQRGYNPARADVARQLRENRLPATTLAEYRHQLRELGARAGRKSS